MATHIVFIDKILNDISNLSVEDIQLGNNLLRKKIVYRNQIIIDRVLFLNGNSFTDDLLNVEGEEIDYIDDEMKNFTYEDSEIQSMGC
jgi:hypothetical protein